MISQQEIEDARAKGRKERRSIVDRHVLWERQADPVSEDDLNALREEYGELVRAADEKHREALERQQEAELASAQSQALDGQMEAVQDFLAALLKRLARNQG